MNNDKQHPQDAAVGPAVPDASGSATVDVSRRRWLGSAPFAFVGGALAGGIGAGAANAMADGNSDEPAPAKGGRPGYRLLLKGGRVLSMDPAVGDFAKADVLVEGSRILAVGPNLSAAAASVIDASQCVVMPGFVDTHHHQYETALRSFLADGLLSNDGLPHGQPNYLDDVLGKLTPVYRPRDVYICELLASLSQIDAGVTTVIDTSQISHTPEHSDAAIAALKEAPRRVLFAYFAGVGTGSRFPQDIERLQRQYFASTDQLLTLAMGSELFEPDVAGNWGLARRIGVPIVSHLVGPAGQDGVIQAFGAAGLLRADNELIHCTRLSPASWQFIKDAGARISLACSIEMTMRHGMPPIQTAIDLGLKPALSVDVECTMTADFFTQMRTALTLQRAFVNERALNGERNLPELLTCRDVIRMATIDGARVAHLDAKTGSLTPGKQADIICLRTDTLNTMPMNNVPGAVVTLMDRSNVDTVLVAGKVLKWRGALVGIDQHRLKRDIEASADYLFAQAGVSRKLF